MDSKTPFMYKGGEGINAGIGEVEWVVSKDRLVLPQVYSLFESLCGWFWRRYKYDAIFDTLNPIDGKVTGAGKYFISLLKLASGKRVSFSAAKTEMVKSKLPNNVLGKIWKLSDVDKDGITYT